MSELQESLYEKKINRKMVNFSSGRIHINVFSEVYRCEGFRIMKVEFKVVLVCWFLILSIFIFDQGEHNEKTV